jgi:GT2 family glycosyltransferase
MEKVSLYVPCYNSRRYLKECLDSVMRQSYPVDEILVIDDGSQDGTADIASAYPARVIRHTRNLGLAAARNRAFKESRNEFVASLDSDCAAGKDWLARLMQCFTDPGIAGAGGTLKERHAAHTADRWRSVHMRQGWSENRMENPPFLYGNNTVLRKGCVEKSGGYDERFRFNYEDADLSLRLYKRGFRLYYNPAAGVEHLRQDSIRSVLFAYWRWFSYYRQAGRCACREKPLRSLAALLGRIAEYADIVEDFINQDLGQKEYRLLPVDAMLIFYCFWMDLRQWPVKT